MPLITIMNMASGFNTSIVSILYSVLGTIIAVYVGTSLMKVSYLLFYRVRVYELRYHKGDGECNWDIQWEDLRLTVIASEVHNDFLEKVSVSWNYQPPTQLGDVRVCRDFKKVGDWPLQVRVNTILRARCPAIDKTEYSVFLHIRRKRWTT